MKFKVGDRIKYNNNISSDSSYGTIVEVRGNWLDYGVRFDIKSKELHNLNGECEDNLVWYCSEEFMESATLDILKKIDDKINS